MPAAPVVELRSVTKTFGPRLAVDKVSLSVEPATTHVLLGSSGSGKSTILRLVLGLLAPDSGEILVNGRPVGEVPRAALATKIGYVVQDGALYPHLTAARNVTLPARAQRWPEARTAERLRHLAELVGLDDALLQLFPSQLSGGQRQRVGLMRALMLDPPVLLLDEPLGALDPIVRADLQAQLRTIFRALAKTVLLVTHDLREAFLLGTTITLMTRGRVVQQGTFADLLERPADAFVTEFMSAQTPPPEMRAYLS